MSHDQFKVKTFLNLCESTYLCGLGNLKILKWCNTDYGYVNYHEAKDFLASRKLKA